MKKRIVILKKAVEKKATAEWSCCYGAMIPLNM